MDSHRIFLCLASAVQHDGCETLPHYVLVQSVPSHCCSVHCVCVPVPLSIPLLMNTWAHFCLLKSCCEHSSTFLLGVQLLDHEHMSNFSSQVSPNSFPVRLHQLIPPPAANERSDCSTALPTLSIIYIFLFWPLW